MQTVMEPEVDEPLAPEGSVQVYVIALALNPPATPVHRQAQLLKTPYR